MKNRILTTLVMIALVSFLLEPRASANAIVASRDRTPPTTPTNFRVTAVSPTSVSFAWSSSTDNSGSFFYLLYANNVVVANVSMTPTTTTLTGLNPSTTYTFKIRARDQSMNSSGFSNSVTATTLSANTAPAAPVLSAPSVGPTHTSLRWTAPSNASPSVRYWIFRDGVQIIAAHQPTSNTFYLLSPGTTHTYTVRARVNNVFSEHSNAVTVTTPQPDPNDQTPPSTPTNLGEIRHGDAEFWLSWTESTDNVTPQEFIRYDVYLNGELSDILVGTGDRSINYGNIGQSNTVEVIAVDEAGNRSAPATLTFVL